MKTQTHDVTAPRCAECNTPVSPGQNDLCKCFWVHEGVIYQISPITRETVETNCDDLAAQGDSITLQALANVTLDRQPVGVPDAQRACDAYTYRSLAVRRRLTGDIPRALANEAESEHAISRITK